VSNLDRIYRGGDGSVVFLRQIGSTVYGFAEKSPTFATVLRGTLTGTKVSGKWWDVPKGERRRTGDLELVVLRAGSGLRKATGGDDFGPDSLTMRSADGIAWAGYEPARFQGVTKSDLAGAYGGNDAGRWYVRESGANVVALGERQTQPGVRPTYASVYVGSRNGNLVKGAFADVPKGLAAESRAMSIVVVDFRRLTITNQRAKTLAPDYAINVDVFAKAIDDAFRGKATGFSYAIARDGTVVRKGAGGFRIAPPDGQLPFGPDTRSTAASTTKTITAIAMLKVLEEKKEVSLGSRIAPFLPKCWKQAKNISTLTTLTFRQLLAHHSGLQGEKVKTSCKKDPWGCLAEVIKLGRTQSTDYKYDNFNYALPRILLPAVLAPEYFKNVVKERGCKDKATLNELYSSAFATYTNNTVLKPAGVSNVFTSLQFGANLYDFRSKTKPGIPVEAGYLAVGAGRLAISAVEFVKILSALERGRILSKATLAQMKAEPMGWDNAFTTDLGGYYSKNGSVTNNGIGGRAQAFLLPAGVQLYVMVNSANNTYKGSLFDIGKDAFAASLK